MSNVPMAPLWIIESPSCTPMEKPLPRKLEGMAPKLTVMRVIWWLVALLTVVPTSEASSSISNSVTVASCRAACLHVFTSPSDARDIKCRKNSDCFMCWNSCGILRHQMGIWGSMCADHTACLPGCQVACGFYVSASRNMGGVRPYMIPPPPPLPAYQPPPRISGRSQVVWGALDWSGSAAPPRDDVIYVLFINSGSGWREVAQTSSRSAHMPPGVSGIPRLRLLAVSQEGIVAASDTLLHSQPTQHGSVEYKVEDLIPDSVETVPERSTTSNLPDHTFSSTQEASESQHSEFFPYEHFESQKVASEGDANPAAPSAVVDPTWSLQVVSVESGIMAEVTVAWESRGSEGVEYLLSWMEETGGVSGHLLTDQLTTDLSLWPGQGYYLQVELVDSQGNAVMKSLPTPVIFKTTTTSTSVTVTSTPSTVTIPQNPTSIPDHTVSHRNPTASIQDDSYRAIWLNNGTLIGHETPLGTTRTYENLQDHTDNVKSSVDDLVSTYSESGHPKATTQMDTGLQGTVPDGEESDQRPHSPTSREGSATGVSAREIPTILASDRTGEEVLWYVGVSIGVLLILILCSLVVWSLGRCRKVPRNDEYIEDRLNGIRESFREDVIRRSRSNPQTSWTFEKCCSSSGDPRMGGTPPPRKDNLPVGIDNASLVENYVLMLESRPPKKKPRH